jgi:hypothetical protein
MTSDSDKQLSFDFMNEPKQLSPKAAEYRAYLRSIRDENPTRVERLRRTTRELLATRDGKTLSATKGD